MSSDFEYSPIIDIVHYFRVIKKYRKRILYTIVVTTLIAVLFNLTTNPKEYQASATLLTGSSNGTPLQPLEEVIDSALLQSDIQAQKGETANSVQISPKQPLALNQAKATVQKAIDAILAQHDQLYNKKLISLDAQIQYEKIQLQESQVYAALLKSHLYAASPSNPYELTILQMYLSLQDKIHSLNFAIPQHEAEKLNYKKTVLKEPMQVTRLPFRTNPFVSVIIGLSLGIIIGVIWSFASEWWQQNKKRLLASYHSS